MASQKLSRASRIYMGINVGYLMLIFLLLSVLGSIGTDVGLLGITRAALVLSLYPALLLFPTSLSKPIRE